MGSLSVRDEEAFTGGHAVGERYGPTLEIIRQEWVPTERGVEPLEPRCTSAVGRQGDVEDPFAVGEELHVE